jgi:teichuronic acid biosynthesis glycosyltransferase TuaG
MRGPAISVIMPAFNAGKYIGEAIESVLSQTYCDWELLIINDGSTDNTQTIIDTFINRDSRIRSLYQENAKQSKARNLGIQHAKGEYIAFLDSDDIMFPDRLSYQIQLLVNSEFDMIFNDAYKFRYNYRIENEESFHVKNQSFHGEKALITFLEMNPVPMLTVMVKKKALLEVGSFSVNSLFEHAEDYHLWLKLLKSGKKIFSTNVIVGAYRIYDQSTTFFDGLSFGDSIYAILDLFKSQEKDLRLKKIFNQKKRIFIAQSRKIPQEVYFKKVKKILLINPRNRVHFKIIKIIDAIFGRKASRRYFSIILWLLYGY